MDTKRIELCVAAERNMLLIIRMTSSGVMSRAGLTLDEIDDVKMAIDETCNMMMLQKPSCSELSFVYEYNEKAVTVQIEGRNAVKTEETENTDSNIQEVIRCILESMVDEVEMVNRKNGSAKTVILKKFVSDQRRVTA